MENKTYDKVTTPLPHREGPGESLKGRIVIELQNVKRYFQVGSETVKALRGVSFKIYEGEFVTIQGTSGSGKSTLLNQLASGTASFPGLYGIPTAELFSVQKITRTTTSIWSRRSWMP